MLHVLMEWLWTMADDKLQLVGSLTDRLCRSSPPKKHHSTTYPYHQMFDMQSFCIHRPFRKYPTARQAHVFTAWPLIQRSISQFVHLSITTMSWSKSMLSTHSVFTFPHYGKNIKVVQAIRSQAVNTWACQTVVRYLENGCGILKFCKSNIWWYG